MQSFNLNLVPGSFQQVFNCSQGDIGRQLTAKLFDGSTEYAIPAGSTVKIKATKPSGFGFDESVTFSGSTVTIITVETMTNEWGRFPAELVITKDGNVIGTANFLFNIEKNPHPDSTVDGDAEEVIPELTLLVERVEAAASSVLDMEVVATTLPAGSQASYSYDEDLNKATFGIPQGEAGAGAAGVVASAYSSSKTYKVGDYVLHNSNLYRCIVAITTAEAFTAAHWTQIVLADDVSDLKTDLIDLGENGFVPVALSPTWQNGYISTGGVINSSSLSQFAIVPLTKGQKITVGTTNSNIGIICTTTADSLSVGDSVKVLYSTSSSNTYQEFSYTALEDVKVVICVLKANYNVALVEPSLILEVEDDLDTFKDGLKEIEKELTWSNGWVNSTTGVINSSTASQFALVQMTRGQTVKVKTANSDTLIIGFTSADSVSVGDELNGIRKATSGDYTEYTFKAEYTINVVICVAVNKYEVHFYEDNNYGDALGKTLEDNSIINNGYYEKVATSNGSFSNGGLFYTTANRIRTDLIPIKAGTRIVISNGSLQHACAIWQDEVATANIKRNDDSFNTNEETVIIGYDGYMVVAFRNSTNTSLSPSDFDGSVKVYPPSYDGIADTLHKLDGARHIRYNNAKPLTILHMSDTHADKVPYNRIIEQAHYFADKIDDMICTGDMVADTYASIISWWNEKVMTCIGNHDTASYSNDSYNWTALSMADRDAYYIAPFESNWDIVHTSGTSYYYKDYTDNNVRLIVMDAMLYNDNGAEATAQTAWLASLLSDAITNGLHVLIAIHSPHGGATPIKCSFTELGTPTMPTWTDCNTPQSVIDTVASAIQNGLHFIGYICGHTHKDQMWDAEDDGKQLMYCVTCATTSTTGTDLNRGVGFDAYNLVTIDTANTKVKIIRGGGADIDFDMRTREAICFDYSTGEILGEVL